MPKTEFWLKWEKIISYFMLGIAVRMPESKSIFSGDSFD